MIRRLLRALAVLGVLGGLGAAVAKLVQGRRATQPRLPSGDETVVPKRSETPLVEPKMLQTVSRKVTDRIEPEPNGSPRLIGAQAPPSRATSAPAATAEGEAASTAGKAAPAAGAPSGSAPWVEPDGSVCPTTHPVKAKLASGIYHLPGMTAYDRTTPDRCYATEEAAESDGLRKAKR